MPWLPRQRRTDAGGPRPGGSIRSSDPPRHPRPAQRHRGQRCADPGGLAGVHGRAGPRCPNGLSPIARHPVLQTVHMRTFCRPSGRRSPSSPTSQMRRSRTSTTPRTLLLIPPTPLVSRSSRRCPLADSRRVPPEVVATVAPMSALARPRLGRPPGQKPEVPPPGGRREAGPLTRFLKIRFGKISVAENVPPTGKCRAGAATQSARSQLIEKKGGNAVPKDMIPAKAQGNKPSCDRAD
jgi:hypothetical protein